MLEFNQVQLVGLHLGASVETPFAFCVLCSLNGMDYYTSWINCGSDNLASFIVLLLEGMIDSGANDDPILEAYTQMRTYIKSQGGTLRPVRPEDFDEKTP